MSVTVPLTVVAIVEFGGITALGVVLIMSRSQLKGARSAATEPHPGAAGGGPGSRPLPLEPLGRQPIH